MARREARTHGAVSGPPAPGRATNCISAARGTTRSGPRGSRATAVPSASNRRGGGSSSSLLASVASDLTRRPGAAAPLRSFPHNRGDHNMPRPQTGQFVEPGSSAASFIPPLRESDLPDVLDQLAHDATVRRETNAERALAALSGSDPTLYPVASVVRPKVMGLLRRHATELAAARAHGERRFLNSAGVQRQEQELREQHAAELAALEVELTEKLEKITAGGAGEGDPPPGGGGGAGGRGGGERGGRPA